MMFVSGFFNSLRLILAFVNLMVEILLREDNEVNIKIQISLF